MDVWHLSDFSRATSARIVLGAPLPENDPRSGVCVIGSADPALSDQVGSARAPPQGTFLWKVTATDVGKLRDAAPVPNRIRTRFGASRCSAELKVPTGRRRFVETLAEGSTKGSVIAFHVHRSMF
ncbi:unnamed protein product [Heligmosomoides polygyrus]|uniref:COesterase domain-containing protein n=1 Tax=Heligmosomoides polygyrus TaxID=6339 RepID=A0A183FQ85_HELPZ|nr:unnamed protein product [Heligmosomoides polygyrus]